MTPAEYAALDAIGLRDLVAGREICIDEVFAAATAVHEATQSRINAVLEWRERDLHNVPHDQPLTGVPFLRKDYGSGESGGLVEMGSGLAEGIRADHTSEFVANLCGAGAFGVGRSAVPELIQHGTTESRLHGITRNPHNPEFSPGGSSGGAAAAVAAGVVPIAHASDCAGSIRIPAAACGLIGLKPGRGTIPWETGGWGGLATEFVLTRSVRDAALCLALLADGPLIEQEGPFRVGLATTHWGGYAEDPYVVNAATAAGRALEHLGHSVVALTSLVPNDQLMELWHPLFSRWVLHDATTLSLLTERPLNHDYLESRTLAVLDRARQLTPRDITEAQVKQGAVTALARSRAKDVDLIVTPTLARSDLRPRSLEDLEYRGPVDLDELAAFEDEAFPYLFVFNVLGWPAVSIPFGIGPAGIPLGVQIAARPGWENVLLAIAEELSDRQDPRR